MQTCSSTANLKEPESCRKRKMFKMGKSEKRWKIEKYILGRTDSVISYVITLRKTAFSSSVMSPSFFEWKFPSEKATWITIVKRNRCTDEFRQLRGNLDALNESRSITAARIHFRVHSDPLFCVTNNQCLLREGDRSKSSPWETGQLWPMGQTQASACFVNKAFLNIIPPIVNNCFCTTRAELSN